MDAGDCGACSSDAGARRILQRIRAGGGESASAAFESLPASFSLRGVVATWLRHVFVGAWRAWVMFINNFSLMVMAAAFLTLLGALVGQFNKDMVPCRAVPCRAVPCRALSRPFPAPSLSMLCPALSVRVCVPFSRRNPS